MNVSWILLTAIKFLKNRRATRGLATAILSSAGIGVGVAALIVVISVMNGFQMGFIEDILEISSYHVRITSETKLPESTLAALRKTPGLRAVVPMSESQTLIYGEFSSLESCRVRGVPIDIVQEDPGFVRQLNLIRGKLDAEDPNAIVLGGELAASLSVDLGSTVSLLSLSGSGIRNLSPETVDFTVTGLFKCEYYQYDRALAILSIDALEKVVGPENRFLYGVKLDRKSMIDRIVPRIEAVLDSFPIEIETWGSYNSAFFSTLRLEKAVMTLLLGLIFLVTGFNTYHSLKRAIFEKREQIAVLRTLGAHPGAVRGIFVFDGFFIGVAGATAGVVIGLLVAGNINGVFAIIENVLNTIIGWVSRLPSTGDGAHQVAFFSPVYFYLTKVPIRMVYAEVIGIFVAGVTSSLLAAYLASRRISSIQPAKVLRYE